MKIKSWVKAMCILLCLCMMFSASGCRKSPDPTGNDTESVDENIKPPKPSKPTDPPTSAEPTRPDISPTDKLIALTFDDGPYTPVTEKILSVLEENGAVATFFVVGDRVDTYKKSLKHASDIGCEIGSHTYSHKNLTKLSAAEIKSQIDQSTKAISDITSKSVKLVRPPEGAVNDSVRANVEYPLIMWSVDSLDWKYCNAEKDYQSVKNSVFDGCIVLMHDLYPATADAVAKFVPELIADGYKFVTVSELMEARGVKIEKGYKYSSAKPKPPESTSTATEKAE